MDDDTKQLAFFLGTVCCIAVLATIGMGLSEWCKHQETLTAIQAGLVQDKDGHWVKEAK
jgi:hypothetical protein